MDMPAKTEFYSSGAEETEAIGAQIARMLGGASVLALYGDLGAGKTTLTRGLTRELGCTEPAKSPTYTIVNEYPGRRRVCHFDMYRLSSEGDLYDIGWEDYLASGALCVVEWSEKIERALPPSAAKAILEKTGENTRKVTYIHADTRP